MEKIVRSNVLGTLLCTKKAVNLLKSQATGGHYFMMDGAGSRGDGTARFATYGFSKAGLPQFLKSMQKELKLDPECKNVRISLLSPGMVFTSLLLGSEDSQKRKNMSKMTCLVFNILADHPSRTADWLSSQILDTVGQDLGGQYIRYLSMWSGISKLLLYPMFGSKTISYCPENGAELLDPTVDKYM